MSDVVVTVPKRFGLKTWIDEGDAAGTDWSGVLWHFRTFGPKPVIEPGERVYIVCEGRLRGYAPLVRLYWADTVRPPLGDVAFIRGGGAVAVTIPESIAGFRGWRYRWWKREVEVPFPKWKEVEKQAEDLPLLDLLDRGIRR
jgi:hypothetical protein